MPTLLYLLGLVLLFIWKFCINLVVYTLSVVPASITDAYDDCHLKWLIFKRRRERNNDTSSKDVGVRKNRRRRRGHRGGRKH